MSRLIVVCLLDVFLGYPRCHRTICDDNNYIQPTMATTTTTTTMTNASGSTFTFPATYSFPPFFTPQPNSSTRHSQLQKWSALIQSWCRHHRIYRLSLIDAIDTPLFHNSALRKRVSLSEARAIVDWMAKSEEDGGGGRRAEWVSAGGAGGVSAGGGEGAGGSSDVGAAAGAAGRIVAWIWWRRPEEWAELLADWVSWILPSFWLENYMGMSMGFS